MTGRSPIGRYKLRTGAAALLSLAVSGCAGASVPAVPPTAQDQESSPEPPAGGSTLGSLLDSAVMSCVSPSPDPQLRKYVASVGGRLAARTGGDWKFRLVDEHRPSAFGLPGSFVYVAVGLLHRVRSEAELAAVLAHEMGHELAGHGRESLAAVFEGGPVSNSPFEDEVEADAIAVELLARSGYDTAALPRVLAMLGSYLPPHSAEELARRIEFLEATPRREGRSGPDRLADSLHGAVLKTPGVALVGLESWHVEASTASPCEPLLAYHDATGDRLSISARSDLPPKSPGELAATIEAHSLYLRPDPSQGAVVVHAAVESPSGAWRQMTYQGGPDTTVEEAEAKLRSMWGSSPGLRLLVIRPSEGDTIESIHRLRCPEADIEWMRSAGSPRDGGQLAPEDFVLCTEEF
ncbi:MAG: M48 family metallopeptidase [Nannocystales bacterium]